MCSVNDSPPYDRPACEHRLWIGGTIRPCGQTVGVTTYEDHTGRKHSGCPRHIDAIRYRWPDEATLSGYEAVPVAQ